jgi:hypothetical protein
MITDLQDKLEGSVTFPWTSKLLTVDAKSKKLDEERRSFFYTFAMNGMILCKHTRQDIQPGFAFLSTQTSEPNEGDWAKLMRIMIS